MLSCGLRRPRMRRSPRRARLRNRPGQCGGFEVTRMRLSVFNGLDLMVSLSRFGCAHREAMGDIVSLFSCMTALPNAAKLKSST